MKNLKNLVVFGLLIINSYTYGSNNSLEFQNFYAQMIADIELRKNNPQAWAQEQLVVIKKEVESI